MLRAHWRITVVQRGWKKERKKKKKKKKNREEMDSRVFCSALVDVDLRTPPMMMMMMMTTLKIMMMMMMTASSVIPEAFAGWWSR